MTRAVRVAAVSMMIVAVAAAGCARKKHLLKDEARIDAPGAPVEDRLTGGGSLDRYRRGLGPEEGGVLKDVYFAYDSYAVSSEARDVLAANAEWLKENPRASTEVEGHCDERGTIEYNLALGVRRAQAIKDYLVSLGVAASRLSTISYGEELPVCRDSGESCWARNRRVHFVPPSSN